MSARQDNRSDGSMINLTGNVSWVDSAYGDNTRAKPHRQDLPYATLAAASAEALAGDLIAVLPGTYDEYNFVKNGVNWYFFPGAVVQYTGAGDVCLISDGASGVNGDLITSIFGFGKFKHNGTVDAAGASNPNATIQITDAQAVVYIEALEITNAVDSDQAENAILQSNGTLTVNCPVITSVNATTPILITGGTPSISQKPLMANADGRGAIPYTIRVDIADASGDTDVIIPHKVRVLDAWALNTGIAAHASLDTWQVKNTANAISDAVAKTATVNAIKRISTVNPTYHEIAAGGILRITAARNTNAAVTVYVLVVPVA